MYNADDTLRQRFVYAGGRLPIAMEQGGATYYLAYDQVGSLRLVVDQTGTVVKEIEYDTYGNIVTDTNPTFTTPIGFAGGLYDADTGLTRFGFRDYDPGLGRWTAKDPIGFGGGSSNIYEYCHNSPVTRSDPRGLSDFGPLAGLPSYGMEALGLFASTGADIVGSILSRTGLSITLPSFSATLGLGGGAGHEIVWLPGQGVRSYAYGQGGVGTPGAEMHLGIRPVFNLPNHDAYTGSFYNGSVMSPITPLGSFGAGLSVSPTAVVGTNINWDLATGGPSFMRQNYAYTADVAASVAGWLGDWLSTFGDQLGSFFGPSDSILPCHGAYWRLYGIRF